MKRTIPALAVTAALLLFSCAKGATDDTIDISGVEMPALLLDIVSANRASVFAPLAPDFWEVAAGLLTSDFNPGEDLRIAAAVRALAGSHRAWYGLSEYPSGVPVGTIARAEAASDINHFFDILRYGYAGYGYFGGDAVFHPLREAMHKRLAEMEDTITVDALLEILAHPLREIIFDNHFGIHAFSFNAPPQSAFLNDDFIVRAAEDGYEMTIYGALHKIIEITYATGEPADEPADCIVPTITKDGEIAYAFGLLSRTASYWRELSSVSITVLLENRATGATISHDLALNKVNTPWRYDPRPVEERPLIEERNVRGIAVLENRSMSGVWADAREMYEEHRNFFRVGENARGKPALIIDMRWNYGGLSLLGLEWVRGFSGRPPAAQGLVAFALATHTHEALSEGSSPPGEANDFAFDFLPWYVAALDEWSEDPLRGPQWLLLEEYPDPRLIPNDTLVVVLIDGSVSSAGEIFLAELMQMENVVVAGVNTAGVRLTGGVIITALPHSELELRFGAMSLSLRPDLAQFEGVGYPPDLWVHPRDSLERALAFIERHGIRH